MSKPILRRDGMAALSGDRILGYLAIAMLAIVLAAIARGSPHWGEAPAMVWVHLALIVPALLLTPAILIGRKGAARHRTLGWTWFALMMAVAATSFAIPLDGRRFSGIWILSAFVLVQLPRSILAARRGDWRAHRAGMRGIVIGAILIAGVFTLPFGRTLGRWLTG